MGNGDNGANWERMLFDGTPFADVLRFAAAHAIVRGEGLHAVNQEQSEAPTAPPKSVRKAT
jgi:hypothetical protein